MEADIPQDNSNIQNKTEDIPEEKEADSYDKLAKGAEVAEPVKRCRGRPKGSRNRVKVPPPPPSESEEEEPPPPHPPPPPASRGRSPQRENPKTHALDVEFDEGYGGAGPPKWKAPVRIKNPPAATRTLMDVVAEAAQQHGARERDRRRTFYDYFLPM